MTAPKPREVYINKLVTKPASEGITEAKFAYAAKVKFAASSRLRCQYDCLAGENRNHFHPPHTPPINESYDLFNEYRYGLMIRREIPMTPSPSEKEWSEFDRIIFEIEQKAFKAGYPRSFVIASGTCCYLHHDDKFRPCIHKDKRRPTFEALGIELLETLEILAWHKIVDRKAEDPFSQIAMLMLD